MPLIQSDESGMSFDGEAAASAISDRRGSWVWTSLCPDPGTPPSIPRRSTVGIRWRSEPEPLSIVFGSTSMRLAVGQGLLDTLTHCHTRSFYTMDFSWCHANLLHLTFHLYEIFHLHATLHRWLPLRLGHDLVAFLHTLPDPASFE